MKREPKLNRKPKSKQNADVFVQISVDLLNDDIKKVMPLIERSKGQIVEETPNTKTAHSIITFKTNETGIGRLVLGGHLTNTGLWWPSDDDLEPDKIADVLDVSTPRSEYDAG